MNVSTSWYSIRADMAKATEPAEIEIYDEIGLWGISAKEFNHQLKLVSGRDINLTLHTPGGDVSDGTAIYNALRKHDGTVNITIDALAASMGSVIALAGDNVRIADNAFVMVHNPWTMVVGNADDMDKAAKDMRKFEQNLVNIYVERTGLEEDEVRELMTAESWLSADEAVEKGFAHEVVKATKAAASIKNFQGRFARTLEQKRPLPEGRPQNNNTKQGQKTMSDNKDKSLELQAELNNLKAAIKSKEEEIEGIRNFQKEADEKHEHALEKARAECAEIIKLAESHKQHVPNALELAVEAVKDGESIEAFKSTLLDAYNGVSGKSDPEETEVEIDANRAPKDRVEFWATYNSLNGRVASKYWNDHKAVLKS